MSKRAVRVSHELWQQMMTQGHVTKVECTIGLPEDAVLIGSFFKEAVRFQNGTSGALEMVADPVFLFEHPSWQEPNDNEYTIVTPEGDKVAVLLPVFEQRYS